MAYAVEVTDRREELGPIEVSKEKLGKAAATPGD